MESASHQKHYHAGESATVGDSKKPILDTQRLSHADHAFAEIATECDLLCSAHQNLKHPGYVDLGDKSIRLLRILPGEESSAIHCCLQEFSLDEPPRYIAVSYAWGSPHGSHEVYVDEHPILIPKNLWRFLKDARALAGDLKGWIWVDMLSINQVDLAERGHQVKLMSMIFSVAERVIVWLGLAYRGSDKAMVALARLSGDMTPKQAARFWASDAGHAMGGICRRIYWRRLWIFQELRLARDVRIMCGRKMAEWRHFETVMSLATIKSGISQVDDNVELVLDTPAMHMRSMRLESLDTGLWNLVEETRHLRCFDLRDKVYALLGVATKGQGSIEPDYSMQIPTLLNSLLNEIWKDAPPDTLDKALEWCGRVEDVIGVEHGTVFVLENQRGQYEPPSEIEMRACKLGSHAGGITLWWTAFYGHSSVQALLRKSWAFSYFTPGDSISKADESTTATVVSLFERLQGDMDRGSSFFSLPITWHGQYWSKTRLEDDNASLDWISAYLNVATHCADSDITLLLLKIGMGLGLFYDMSPLFYAVNHGSIPALKAVLAIDCFDVNSTDSHGRTPLMAAARRGHLEAMRVLMACPTCDLNCSDHCGKTLLMTASGEGNAGVVRAFLQTEHYDAKATDCHGWTALMHAVSPEETGTMPCSRGDKCNFRQTEGRRDFGYRSGHLSDHNQVLTMLLKKDRLGINARDKHGQTPLILAVKNGACINFGDSRVPSSFVQHLLDSDACDVDLKSDSGDTALSIAIEMKQVTITRMLITRGHANLDVSGKAGKTLLGIARDGEHTWAEQMLINEQRLRRGR